MIDTLIYEIFQRKFGDKQDELRLPPPVFETMQGEFVDFDQEVGVLTTRFPVLSKFLNPYSTMQGGIIAAAVDNTIGPLSLLVASPNVTHRLEMKYSRLVTPDLGHIIVKAKFLERNGRRLTFKADVRDPSGNLLARARASHWIIDESE